VDALIRIGLSKSHAAKTAAKPTWQYDSSGLSIIVTFLIIYRVVWQY